MLNTPNGDDSCVWAPTHTSMGDFGVGAADRRTRAVKSCSVSEQLLQTGGSAYIESGKQPGIVCFIP